MKTSFLSSEKLEWAAADFDNLAYDLTGLLKLRRAVQEAEEMTRNKTKFTPSRRVAPRLIPVARSSWNKL
jgi:hypothetical protein